MRYTVPQHLAVEAMPPEVTVRFRVSAPFREKYLACYINGTRVFHGKKRIMAPGRDGTVHPAPGRPAGGRREIVFCVEED